MTNNPQESQPRRLTRKEKLAQQQTEQKPVRSTRVVGRNRLIQPILGISAAVALAAAAIGGYFYIQDQADQQAALIVDQDTAKTIIQEKIVSLGIQKNSKETELWDQMQNTADSQKDSLTGNSIMNHVVGAMAASENPYLQEAYQTMVRETKNGNLFLQTIPFPSDRPYLSNETSISVFSTSMEVFNGKAMVITRGYNEVLLTTSPDQIAQGIAVEMKHVRNILDIDLPNKGLSPEMRVSKYINWLIQTSNYVKEEASGFMEASLVTLYHLGLTGKDSSNASSYTVDNSMLAKAIQANFNNDNPDWLNYIDKQYGFSKIIEEKKKAQGLR